MSIWNICGAALLFAFCAMAVGRAGAQSFPFVSVFACVSVLLYAVIRYSEPLAYIRELAESTGVSEYIALVLKVVAIGYIVGLCADVCRDMGETRIASGIELCGRVEIILLCLPLISEIIDTAVKMTGS